jgi:hypothetical protein
VARSRVERGAALYAVEPFYFAGDHIFNLCKFAKSASVRVRVVSSVVIAQNPGKAMAMKPSPSSG